MSSHVSVPDASRFGLDSFADVLPSRDPIIGEDAGSFVGFHEGLMRSLVPATPYECVIAENLIAIEWELLQHRRMRDAGLQQKMRKAIRDAVVSKDQSLINAELEEAYDLHIKAGGDDHDWKEPFHLDTEASEEAGYDMAERAISRDREVQAAAYAEIAELGLQPVELMSQAYSGVNGSVNIHDGMIQQLERRRREVMRDYGVLQKTRPLQGEVVEG